MNPEKPQSIKTPEAFNETRMLSLLGGMLFINDIKSIDDIGTTYVAKINSMAKTLTDAIHNPNAIPTNVDLGATLKLALDYLTKESNKSGITDAQKQAILKECDKLNAIAAGLSFGGAFEKLWNRTRN